MKFYVFILTFLISLFSFSQRNVKDSILSTPWVGVHYGGNWTQNDLAERFGYLSHLGFTAGYKTNKNWFWGLDANFIFGNKVRITGVFDDLVDSHGNITDISGDVAKVVVLARGFNANLTFGKIIPIFNYNKNSGIFLHGGVGFLAHKMRVETQDQVVPQIELDYRKGYDRLTNGINTHQFIGYAFLSNSGLINFYAGFYMQEGFTKNKRTIFFDQPEIPVSQELRQDIQIGFRTGWFIPIYKRKPKEFYID
ncbi:MAG: hypothetical protein V4622_04950 [Bacteroidota bacterium]